MMCLAQFANAGRRDSKVHVHVHVDESFTLPLLSLYNIDESRRERSVPRGKELMATQL